MAKNKAILEKSRMWGFLLWTREVNKIVLEEKVTGFVHTYQIKTKKTKVGQAIVDFSTPTIAKVFQLTTSGLNLDNVPNFARSEAEEIFELRVNWVKGNKWNIEGARNHWKGWFEMINAYFLFQADGSYMNKKAVSAAI